VWWRSENYWIAGYGKPTQFVGSDENAGPITNHIRVSFVKPDGTETDDLDEATTPA
jgi:hypothetical protein